MIKVLVYREVNEEKGWSEALYLTETFFEPGGLPALGDELAVEEYDQANPEVPAVVHYGELVRREWVVNKDPRVPPFLALYIDEWSENDETLFAKPRYPHN